MRTQMGADIRAQMSADEKMQMNTDRDMQDTLACHLQEPGQAGCRQKISHASCIMNRGLKRDK